MAVTEVLEALKSAYDLLKGIGRLRKKDRERIERQARRLIKLATPEDIEKFDTERRRAVLSRVPATSAGRFVAHKKRWTTTKKKRVLSKVLRTNKAGTSKRIEGKLRSS